MYMKLITALALIGYTIEHYIIESNECGEGYTLRFTNTAADISITIGITQTFHVYPGSTCYFVNYANLNGDFTACMGTPHVEQALFDLGSVIYAGQK